MRGDYYHVFFKANTYCMFAMISIFRGLGMLGFRRLNEIVAFITSKPLCGKDLTWNPQQCSKTDDLRVYFADPIIEAWEGWGAVRSSVITGWWNLLNSGILTLECSECGTNWTYAYCSDGLECPWTPYTGLVAESISQPTAVCPSFPLQSFLLPRMRAWG